MLDLVLGLDLALDAVLDLVIGLIGSDLGHEIEPVCWVKSTLSARYAYQHSGSIPWPESEKDWALHMGLMLKSLET
jgi:hypothetical protein